MMQQLWSTRRLALESALVGFSAIMMVSRATTASEVSSVYTANNFSTENNTIPSLDDQWQKMVVTHLHTHHGMDDRMIFCVGTWLATSGLFITMNSGLFLMEYFQIFQVYKIQQNKYPPRPLIKEALVAAAFNNLIFSPLGLYFVVYPYVVVPSGMDISGPMPSLWTILWQYLVCFVLNETLYYFIHRLLHHPKVFKHIHRKHHRFHAPIGISCTFAHPVEDQLANAWPTLAGPLLLGSHCTMLWIWLFLRMEDTIETHSGYQFPLSYTRMMNGSKRHDFHHSHNNGMFGGTMLFWDWIFGTDVPYLEYQMKLERSKGKSE